jgi:hypothetical protein
LKYVLLLLVFNADLLQKMRKAGSCVAKLGLLAGALAIATAAAAAAAV